MVRSLGADHVIDYTVDDFLGDPGQYDLIVQLAGAQSVKVLRPLLTKRGTLVLSSGEGGRWFGPLGRLVAAIAFSPFVSQRLRTFVATSTSANLADLTELIESEQVTPVVDRAVPLAEMAAALRHFQQPHGHGKTVITVDHPL
jgi:NADPH:quinone reductase-like Zn-dependent oxidoreductase